MKKILFVMKSTNIGGVEKSLVSLLNTMSKDEYEIDLLLLEKKGELLNHVPEWVNVMCLNEYRFIKNAVNLPPRTVIKEKFKKGEKKDSLILCAAYIASKILGNGALYYKAVFRNIKNIPKEYDVAIAYSSIINYISWLVCYHVKAKEKIGWIHFDISRLRIDKKLFLKLHRKMDRIYIVSKQGYDIFCNMFPQLKSKCEVKYNIVDKQRILSLANENVEMLKERNEKIIVTLGRIEQEKGQDIIPSVAERLRQNGVDFKWYLIGDGKGSRGIKEEIERKELSDKIMLLGTKSNPYPYLKQADIYVQTSVHEGFCITLAEAKVFDPVIISTDFTGASEQLKNYNNSFVVSRNVQELTKAIQKGVNILEND